MSKLADRTTASRGVECTLFIPTYNEAGGIRRCLEAIASSPLPHGAAWSEWVVLDDSPSDETAREVVRWGREHPEVPLRVDRSPARRGKAVALEAARAALAARAAERRDGIDVLMIGADADTRPTAGALTALIKPFLADASLGVAWGLSVPEGRRRRRRASWFQMASTAELTRRLGPDAIRAEGRLFAVRLSALPSFTWRPDLINEDSQLAEFVRRAGVCHRSVPDAMTRVTPAEGWRDFYLQTYRLFATDAAIKAAWGPAPAAHGDGSHRMVTALAVARVSVSDPAGLPAYLSARAVAALMHRLSPAVFGDRWELSMSTKAALPPKRETSQRSWQRHGGAVVAKVAVAGRVVIGCKNWAQVISRIGGRHIPGVSHWIPGEVVFAFRSGVTVRTPRGSASWAPIEVFLDDSYHLDRLPWEPTYKLRVLDIGAHVGSFAVAIGVRYKNATVACFEPSAEASVYLLANLGENHLESRVVAVCSAVGANAGTSRLFQAELGSLSASLVPEMSEPGSWAIECSVVDLGTAMATSGGPELVKMDCEGGEYDIVLRSDPHLWDTVRCVLLEHHPVPEHSWDELLTRFEGYGFHCEWHGGENDGFGQALLVRGKEQSRS